jgi:uncharacterized membrane protein (UPF0136 family)
VIVVVALLIAALFGAGDQYLGSFSMHPWMADASLLSAPWLVLAFLAGCTQREAKRAAMLGLGCTLAALVGYGLMTLSPVENAHLTVTTGTGFLRSSSRIFLAGLVTGPLFAWFGQRWRAGESWVGALATAGTLCLEPLAHAVRSGTVRMAEIAVGLALAGLVMARVAVREPTR